MLNRLNLSRVVILSSLTALIAMAGCHHTKKVYVEHDDRYDHYDHRDHHHSDDQ